MVCYYPSSYIRGDDDSIPHQREVIWSFLINWGYVHVNSCTGLMLQVCFDFTLFISLFLPKSFDRASKIINSILISTNRFK